MKLRNQIRRYLFQFKRLRNKRLDTYVRHIVDMLIQGRIKRMYVEEHRENITYAVRELRTILVHKCIRQVLYTLVDIGKNV